MNHEQTSRKADDDDEELIEPLSGNPFFHVTLTKSSVSPMFRLFIPVEGAKILPKKDVEATLIRGRKTWLVTYLGGRQPRFHDPSWSHFVVGNKLKINDVCVFELMTTSSDTAVTLKVQVLRGDFPSALQDKSDDNTNSSPENPIVIE